MTATWKLTNAVALSALLATCGIAQATPTIDGVLSDGDYMLLDDNTGGPAPGFGAGHETNAAYAFAEPNNFYVGVAGDLQSGNRILVFLDTKAGGFGDGSFDRTGAPAGLSGWNSASQFDAGFTADYCLVIGTDGGGTYFFDLYTLSSGTGSNNFLGDQGGANLGASPASGDVTQGFEARLTFNDTGSGVDMEISQGTIGMFVAYAGDSGFLSNQFLTPAGAGDGNYGDGPVDFGAAAPNPMNYSNVNLPVALEGFVIE